MLHKLTNRLRINAILIGFAVGLSGCGASARYPVSAGQGSHPVVPSPTPSLIPQVNYVKAKGWPAGAQPVATDGMTVTGCAPAGQPFAFT